jgi:hypothetical protein
MERVAGALLKHQHQDPRQQNFHQRIVRLRPTVGQLAHLVKQVRKKMMKGLAQFVEDRLPAARLGRGGSPPVATLGGRAAERAEPRLTLEADGTGVAPVGFGREERRVRPEAARGGLLEVIAAGTGERVLTAELPEALVPPVGKAWEPLELLAIVDVAGLAGPLVVTESSRVEEVDAHFRRQLRQVFRLGERLAPGVYRVVVGP